MFGGVFPQSGEPEILKIIVLKIGLSTVQTVPKFPLLSLGRGEGAVNEGIGILNRTDGSKGEKVFPEGIARQFGFIHIAGEVVVYPGGDGLVRAEGFPCLADDVEGDGGFRPPELAVHLPDQTEEENGPVGALDDGFSVKGAVQTAQNDGGVKEPGEGVLIGGSEAVPVGEGILCGETPPLFPAAQ